VRARSASCAQDTAGSCYVGSPALAPAIRSVYVSDLFADEASVRDSSNFDAMSQTYNNNKTDEDDDASDDDQAQMNKVLMERLQSMEAMMHSLAEENKNLKAAKPELKTELTPAEAHAVTPEAE